MRRMNSRAQGSSFRGSVICPLRVTVWRGEGASPRFQAKAQHHVARKGARMQTWFPGDLRDPSAPGVDDKVSEGSDGGRGTREISRLFCREDEARSSKDADEESTAAVRRFRLGLTVSR